LIFTPRRVSVFDADFNVSYLP